MKITRFGLAVVAAWICVTSAYAQQEMKVITDAPEAVDSVTVTARRFHMAPQEFAYFEFEYVLNNGEIVRFSRRVGRFYVAFRGQKTVEIFPHAADRFSTKGGAELVFTEDGDALDIDHYEVLRAESGLPLASVSAAPQ